MEVGVAKKLSISIFFVCVDCEVFFSNQTKGKRKKKTRRERERKRRERRKRFD